MGRELSNACSEGTDLLLKAMINKMLQNVFKDGASKRLKRYQVALYDGRSWQTAS
ncbi:MAG: hypothetical protein ABIN01_23725 [Ferruginibacter sp.]